MEYPCAAKRGQRSASGEYFAPAAACGANPGSGGACCDAGRARLARPAARLESAPAGSRPGRDTELDAALRPRARGAGAEEHAAHRREPPRRLADRDDASGGGATTEAEAGREAFAPQARRGEQAPLASVLRAPADSGASHRLDSARKPAL